MNGLVWKALRREWFLVRWIEWAWIVVRRGTLHARWAVRDAARWLVAGWGGSWIEWRWRHVSSAGTFVAAVFTELLRPLSAIAQALLLGVADRDRKWVTPAISGTIGLLLLLLLFTRFQQTAASSPSLLAVPVRPVDAVDDGIRAARSIRIVETPVLRDPFAGLSAPVTVVEPDPVPEPAPVPEPLPVALAELDVHVTRDAVGIDWQPHVDAIPERHVSSAARTIAPLPVRLDEQFVADGWSRFQPRMVDPNLLTVAHGFREYALATASSTIVEPELKPIPRREPEPPPVVEEPPEPDPVPVESPPAVEPEPEPTPQPEVKWEARPLRSTEVVGRHCVLDLKLANVGTAPATDLVVRIDLPEQLEHELGSAIDLPVGTLGPGETRTARLVALASRPGRGAFEVRLSGESIEETRSPGVVVSKPPPKPERSTPSRAPVLGLCCPTR